MLKTGVHLRGGRLRGSVTEEGEQKVGEIARAGSVPPMLHAAEATSAPLLCSRLTITSAFGDACYSTSSLLQWVMLA